MNKYIFITVFFSTLIMLSSSCFTTKCKIDEKFQNDFFYNIEVVEATERGELQNINNYLTSLNYLMKLTKCEAQIFYDEAPRYKNEKALNEDIQSWEKWYEDNKCDFTKEKADSITQKNSSNKQ